MFTSIIKQIVRPMTDPFKEVLAKVDEALVGLDERTRDHARRLVDLEDRTKHLDRLFSWVDVTQFELQRAGVDCGIYCPACGHVSRSQNLEQRITAGVGERQTKWCCKACGNVIRTGEVEDSVLQPLGADRAAPSALTDCVLGEQERVSVVASAGVKLDWADAQRARQAVVALIRSEPPGAFWALHEVGRRLGVEPRNLHWMKPAFEELRDDGDVREVAPGIWERVR